MDGSDDLNNGRDQPATDNDDFKVKGAASLPALSNTSSTASLEDCTICLQPITERAVAVPCNHLSFDFVCLVSWLQQRESCPLCNAKVTSVQFDWRSPDDYKSFQVRSKHTQKRQGREAHEEAGPNVQRYGSHAGFLQNARRSRSVPQPIDPAVERRRRVYRDGLYSYHVGANRISGHRAISPQEFSKSQLLQRRARTFLRRELKIFLHSNSHGGIRNKDFILEYIIAMLKKFDPKGADGRAEDLLSEFINRPSARLLLHELLAWLRSPYTMLSEWDESVQYFSPIGERAGKGPT